MPEARAPRDFGGAIERLVFVALGLPGGGYRSCRVCLRRRDELLAEAAR